MSANSELRSRMPPRTYSTRGAKSGPIEVSVNATTWESRLLKAATAMSGDSQVLSSHSSFCNRFWLPGAPSNCTKRRSWTSSELSGGRRRDHALRRQAALLGRLVVAREELVAQRQETRRQAYD